MSKTIYGIEYIDPFMGEGYLTNFYQSKEKAEELIRQITEEQVKNNTLAELCNTCDFPYTENKKDICETCPFAAILNESDHIKGDCPFCRSFDETVYYIRPYQLEDEE